MDLFVLAARKKFRFATSRGQVTVEDLWEMSLTSRDDFNLDNVAINLDEQVDTKSFVKRRSAEGNVNQQKLEIVKFIIETKIVESEAAELAAMNKQKKDKLLAILASKEEQKLAGLSEEEIRAEIAKL